MKDKLKLEVGMYVRTEEGEIFKTDGDKYYLSNNKKIFYRSLSRIPYESASYKVIKTSFNVIDLIEEGDYVNGNKVIYVEDLDGLEYLFIDADGESYYSSIYKKCNEPKSIVTHEQFDNIKYEVK